MGWIGGTGAADLSITNCSFEDTTAYGVFLGRDTGSGGVGSVMIANNEIGCPTCIGTDGSGFLTLISISGNVLNIEGTTAASFGMSLNNVSNVSIGPNVINAQNAGTPFGIGITSTCSNGKIAPQVFTGMPAANRISNGSTSVVYNEVSQKGAIPNFALGAAYGSLFTGTVAVNFAIPFSVAPSTVNVNAQPSNGCFAALAINITAAGFTAQGFGVTNGGVATNMTYSTQGGVM
jgi:hypothetical protein